MATWGWSTRPCVASWVCASLAACSSGATPGAGNGGDLAGTIKIQITAPATKADGSAPIVSGTVKVFGSLAYDAGVLPSNAITAEIVGIDASRVDCTVLANSAFACEVDTAQTVDGKPIVACAASQTLLVSAFGSAAGGLVTATAGVDVLIDNCPPSLGIDAPDDGLPFVGSVTVVAHVTDPLLTEAHLTVTDPDGKSVLSAPVELPADKTTWTPSIVLDRSLANKTEELTITLSATNAAGLTSEVHRTITSVKRPYFLGSDNDVDRQDPSDPAGTKPATFAVTDFALGPKLAVFTQTPPLAEDNLMDVVVGTNDGLVVRAGLPLRDGTGLAEDAPQYHPNGSFDNPTHDKLYAALRVIRGTVAVHIVRVFLKDLDGDGDLDILAVGATENLDSVAWAILHVKKTVPDAPPLDAYKLVDVHPLPAAPLSAALADLDADGLPDLLVGAAVADVGLMTVLLNKAPMCTSTDGSPPRLCEQFTDYDTLDKAQIFASATQTTLHKGVTGVSSIATGDFYKDDKNLNDVCVGESARGIVSCYRNVTHDGNLAQAQDSYTFGDAQDTHAIVSAEFSTAAGDGPDLIVQSKSGHFVRWLTGDHNGSFKYVEGKIPTRDIFGLGCSELGVGPVGPGGFGGKPYLTAISDTRKVSIIPTQLDDNSHELQCFRSWVMGSRLTKVDSADLNGDGAPDLVALDADQPGLTVAFGQLGSNGKFNGNFLAPDAHHVCGRARNPLGGYGVYDIGEAVLSDYDGDKRLDLTAISALGGVSTGPQCVAGGPIIGAWTFGVFLNTASGVVNPQPRQGEFAATVGGEWSTRNSCDDQGQVRSVRAGDVNGDGLPDLVTTRNAQPYFVGSTKDACDCCFLETKEIDNLWGPQIPPFPVPKGCSPQGHCRDYADKNDDCFAHPLVGFGGGAPLTRASANVFLSGTAGPLGLGVDCAVGNICEMAPFYSFAAGSDPQGLVLADLNHDGKLDVATAMDAFSAPCVQNFDPQFPQLALLGYMAPRLRVFAGDGAGKFTPVTVGAPQDEVVLKPCEAPVAAPNSYPVTYRILVEGVTALQAGIWPNAATGKFDFSLFALGLTNGQIEVLPHATGFDFTPAVPFALGTDVRAFAVRDVNFDPHLQVDVLALTGVDLSFLPGAVASGGKSGFFDTKVTLAEGPQTADWLDAGDLNADGFQDFILLDKQTATLEIWLGVGRSPTPLSTQFVKYPGRLRAAIDAADTDLADMDGDGCVDIVVRSKRAVTVLHNEGIGCSGALLKK